LNNGETMQEIFEEACNRAMNRPVAYLDALCREIEAKWPFPESWFTHGPGAGSGVGIRLD
jgi:hypothetical protein